MSAWLAAFASAAIVILIALHARPRDEHAPPSSDAQLRPLLRGMNYLLSDQPDRALRTLIEVARMHGELAEVYMALGEMFRARGEYGRAVRIHQNLLARPGLDPELRFQAAWALAQDFHAGGLLDRALRQYAKVLEMRPDHLPAIEASLRIREDSAEWDEALALLDRLERASDRPRPRHRAHLIAQQALAAQQRGDHQTASARAGEALGLDAGCGAARLALLRELLRGDASDAATALPQALDDWQRDAPGSLPVAIGEIGRSAPAPVRDAAFDWLRRHATDEPTRLAWIEAEHARQGLAAAQRSAEELGFSPQTLRGWLRLQAATRDGHEGELARRWRAGAADWRCEDCGVVLREIRWRCPQCHAWGTMQPILEEEPACPPA